MLTSEDNEFIERILDTARSNLTVKATSYQADVQWLITKLRALDNKVLEHEMAHDPNGKHAQEAVHEILKALADHGYWNIAVPTAD